MAGKRFNKGKPRWSLVHYKSIEPLVRVLEFGAKKYGIDNWKKGLKEDEILDSAFRHIIAMMDGEYKDAESGLSHAGHVIANMMFYQYYKDNGDNNP